MTLHELTQTRNETEVRPTVERRLLTAAALVAAPLLIGVGDLVTGADPSTSGGLLSDVAAAPHRFLVGRGLFYAGMLLLLPGVITLLRLASVRGRRWATVGAVLTGVGAAGFGGGEFALGLAMPLLSDSAIERSQAVIAADHMQADALTNLPFMLGLLAFVGLAVAGVGVVRSGAVSRLLGVALVAAPVLWLVTTSGNYTVGAAGCAIPLVTYLLVARRVSPATRAPLPAAVQAQLV